MLVLNGGAGSEKGAEPAETTTTTPSPDTIPGDDIVTRLSTPRVHEGSGTETVDLGSRPDEATAISTTLTCLSAGTLRWPDGASMTCTPADEPTPSHYDIDLGSDQDHFVITADDGVRWRLRTVYVSKAATQWGVNSNGDTYGVANDQGSPDLVYVAATNGQFGYVYNADLEHATGGDVETPEEAVEWMENGWGQSSTLPVFEADGETVIGEFLVGGTCSDGPCTSEK